MGVMAATNTVRVGWKKKRGASTMSQADLAKFRRMADEARDRLKRSGNWDREEEAKQEVADRVKKAFAEA